MNLFLLILNLIVNKQYFLGLFNTYLFGNIDVIVLYLQDLLFNNWFFFFFFFFWLNNRFFKNNRFFNNDDTFIVYERFILLQVFFI